jgi:hypothetical protein
MRVGGQRHAPAALPQGKTRYPLYRRLGEPQGRSGRLRKISSPPGFDPRTVQPVASRYTDYDIPANKSVVTKPTVKENTRTTVMLLFDTPQKSYHKYSCTYLDDKLPQGLHYFRICSLYYGALAQSQYCVHHVS